jgi:primase-polymerase (primpol)-like protein
VFSGDDQFVGIDLDDCRDTGQGTIDDWAAQILRAMDTYGEVSPSGTGLKLICRARSPAGKGRKNGDIETYDRGKYFTVTGATAPGCPATVNERQAAYDQFWASHFGAKQRNSKPLNRPKPTQGETSQTPLDDETVLRNARRAKNAGKFLRLWDGDGSDYKNPDGSDDHSRADMALVEFLAFHAGEDRAQIDRLFRRSKLMREKWDARTCGTETYGQWTISKVLNARERADDDPPPP